MDRRKVRTRRMLRDALLELILERGYDTISIQDITDRADLRRATFYLHYKYKDELLLATLAEIFEILVADLEPVMAGKVLGGKTQIEPYLVVIRHVAENAALYHAIMSSSASAIVTSHLRDYLAGHFARSLRDVPKEKINMPLEVLAQFVAGAELTLVTWWLKNGQPYSAEVMAGMIRDTILTGVKGALAEGVLEETL